MRRGVLTSARLHQEELTEGGVRFRAAMFTLTYRPGVEWHGRHISEYVKHVREYLARRRWRCRLVWVLEMQARGAAHYHVIVWLPRGITLPMPDKSGWWKHGSSRSEWARKAVGYIAKYASKIESKTVALPKGARLWSQAGLQGETREILRWWIAPRWLRAFIVPGETLRKVGCWWENRTTRIAYRSPWAVDSMFGGPARFFFLGWTEESVRFF